MAFPRERYGVFRSSYWQSTTLQNASTFPSPNDSSQTTIAFPYHHLTHKEQLEFSKKFSTKSLHGSERGFRFFGSKNDGYISTNSSSPSSPTELLDQPPVICNIPRTHFRPQHSWTPHIKSLKTKCINSINTLKYLSHPHTSCNHEFFPQLYTRA